jgi:hypothetical protein
MGNLSSICIDKGGSPDLETLFEVKADKTFDCGVHQSYASCVHLWRFHETGDSRVTDSPIRLLSFKKFDSKECYAALHIFNKQYTANGRSTKESTPSSTPGTPLGSLLASSEQSLTPKGLALPFGYVPLEPLTLVSGKSLQHTLYLWHGRDATELTRAVALGKVLAMDKLLSSEEKALRLLFSDVQKLPLSDIFANDTTNERSFAWNHLFYYSDLAYGTSVHNPQPEKIMIPKLHNITPLRSVSSCNGNSEAPAAPSMEKKKPSIPGLAIPARATVPTSTVPSLSFSPIPSLTLPIRPSVGPSKISLNLALAKTLPGDMRNDKAVTGSHSSNEVNTLGADYVDPTGVPEDKRKKEKLAYFDKVCSEITSSMFLGSQTIAMDENALREHGITHIVNCAGGICNNYHPSTFNYKTLYLGDGHTEDINCMFYDVIEFIEDAHKRQGKVFVHCQQGVSRSSAMLICYLMWKTGQDYNATHEAVKRIRGVSNPNTGFMCQLVAWWGRLTGKTSNPHWPRLYRIVPHCRQTPDFIVMKLVPAFQTVAESLDTRGCFLLHTPDSLWVWIGSECPAMLVERGDIWAGRLVRYENAPKYVHVSQGQEPPTFWEAFPGGGPPSGGIKTVPALDSEYELTKLVAPPSPFPSPSCTPSSSSVSSTSTSLSSRPST